MTTDLTPEDIAEGRRLFSVAFNSSIEPASVMQPTYKSLAAWLAVYGPSLFNLAASALSRKPPQDEEVGLLTAALRAPQVWSIQAYYNRGKRAADLLERLASQVAERPTPPLDSEIISAQHVLRFEAKKARNDGKEAAADVFKCISDLLERVGASRAAPPEPVTIRRDALTEQEIARALCAYANAYGEAGQFVRDHAIGLAQTVRTLASPRKA